MELPGAAALGADEPTAGAAEARGGEPAGTVAEPMGAADPMGAAADAMGVADPMGSADPQAAISPGLAEGDGEADGMTVGAGLGRSPTGSGPTNTNAARMPTATRTPTSRPASIVTPVFIAAEGTSTDERGRGAQFRC